MQNLKVTLIQTNIIWENIALNLTTYESEYLLKIKKDSTDLILFPELFTTGFTMNTKTYSESMTGKTIAWMKNWATKLNTQIGGSLIINENGQYYNRFVIVSKNGIETHYDKRHLFRMGDENNHFTAGANRIIHHIKGWNLLLQVCYDLRFPVFSRNKTIANQKEFDAILYIANWPEVRSNIWTTLIKARAIENQVYAIGVNRIGVDAHQINHSGNTICVNPWGETSHGTPPNKKNVAIIELQKEDLTSIKSKFPAFLDADSFHLTIK